MMKKFPIYFNFSYLASEWKSLFSPNFFMNDLSAGITVAFIAIPLSLAIALASGVTPAAALVTAIIAGIVCSLFGGAPLAVSGPAAAMSVLLADTVEKFGLSTFIFIGLLAGLMQLLSGMAGLGRFSRYVPLPVIAGFTAGIGVIILIGQLPRAFGLLPPAESHILDVFYHIKEYSHLINWNCLLLVIFTIAVIRVLPRFFPRLPAPLIAVGLSTLIVSIFHLTDIPVIGHIPRSLPVPSLPVMPQMGYVEILLSAFTIFLLASLETLLSTSAIDKLTRTKKHDPNQELIGQGLGNIAVSLFGGMPVSGVIARSATNVRAGAKTRRASIIHSLVMLLAVFVIAPWISIIPIAALAGVLFSVAFSMVNYREFHALCRTSPSEAFIYAITFVTIISVDLLAGVQAGIIVASLIVLYKATKTHLHITSSSEEGVIRLSITGSLTFLSSKELTDLEKKLESTKMNQTVILDLSNINNLDSSGAGGIIDIFNYCKNKQVNFFIKGLPRRFERLFKLHGGEELLEKYYLVSENDLRKKENVSANKSSRDRLIHGLQLYYKDIKSNDRRLYDYIVSQQDPHTLFITCSDSRIIPNTITSTDPGELFTIRNVGNFIPPYHSSAVFSEAAALEFALSSLNITDIVICGHANCGAIRTCLQGKLETFPPKLKSWIEMMRSELQFTSSSSLNDIAKTNVVNQINTLKQYPEVMKKESDGQPLGIHGWFFDFEEHLVYEWNKEDQRFHPLITLSEKERVSF